MRLITFFKKDTVFQWKQGIHLYYGIATVVYIILLKLTPPSYRSAGTLVVLFSDPTVLGFFFSGIILYLDKEILPTLFMTPLRISEYILSRIISFFIISFVISTTLLILFFKTEFNLTSLFLGLLASAPFFTVSGMLTALFFRDAGSFLIIGGFSMALFALPFMELLPFWTPAVYLPTRSTMQLFFQALYQPIPGGKLWLSFLVSITETAAMFLLCRQKLHQFTRGTLNWRKND